MRISPLSPVATNDGCRPGRRPEEGFADSCFSSDADADVLADYVLALLQHDGDAASIRRLCEEETQDFLREEGKPAQHQEPVPARPWLTWLLRRLLQLHRRRLQSTRRQVVPAAQRTPETCRVSHVRSQPASPRLQPEPSSATLRGGTSEWVEEALVPGTSRGRGSRRLEFPSRRAASLQAAAARIWRRGCSAALPSLPAGLFRGPQPTLSLFGLRQPPRPTPRPRDPASLPVPSGTIPRPGHGSRQPLHAKEEAEVLGVRFQGVLLAGSHLQV